MNAKAVMLLKILKGVTRKLLKKFTITLKHNAPISRNVNYFTLLLVTFGDKLGEELHLISGSPKQNKQMRRCTGLKKKKYIYIYLHTCKYKEN